MLGVCRNSDDTVRGAQLLKEGLIEGLVGGGQLVKEGLVDGARVGAREHGNRVLAGMVITGALVMGGVLALRRMGSRGGGAGKAQSGGVPTAGTADGRGYDTTRGFESPMRSRSAATPAASGWMAQ